MKSNKNKLLLFGFFFFFSLIPLTNYAACYWIEPPPPANQPLKLAFFIYASDVATESIIRPYADILGYDYGYIAFLYEDSNIDDVLDDIDDLEDYNDMLFFCFIGHGTYNEEGLQQSRVHYTPALTIGSMMLRYYFDQYEAGSIAVLIDSCHSGEFVDRFEDNDKYLIMTSSDENHTAYAYNTLPCELIFSDYFWNYVDGGDDAITAFYKTRADNYAHPAVNKYGKITHWIYRYPQITDTYGGYNFF